MQVVGVVGPQPERRAAVERLLDRLAREGQVGVVDATVGDDAPEGLAAHREAGARVAYGVDGSDRVATGGGTDLESVLDELARDCDYGLVVGRPDAGLPTVVVGDGDVRGDVLARPDDAADLDLEAVREGIHDTEPRETLASLVRRVTDSPEEIYAGAIATFTGRVRAKDHPDDDETEHLAFERYGDVVEERMDGIRSSLEARKGVYEVRLHHRTGVMEAGEDVVYVVVLAGHRAEAFETVEDGIDRLKEVVPLFKKEVTVEEEFWAHERE